LVRTGSKITRVEIEVHGKYRVLSEDHCFTRIKMEGITGTENPDHGRGNRSARSGIGAPSTQGSEIGIAIRVTNAHAIDRSRVTYGRSDE
jgi:hypothetical protein